MGSPRAMPSDEGTDERPAVDLGSQVEIGLNMLSAFTTTSPGSSDADGWVLGGGWGWNKLGAPRARGNG